MCKINLIKYFLFFTKNVINILKRKEEQKPLYIYLTVTREECDEWINFASVLKLEIVLQNNWHEAFLKYGRKEKWNKMNMQNSGSVLTVACFMM